MIGGKVLDPGALVSYLDGRLAVVSWLAVAPEIGLVLYLPDLVLQEVATLCPDDGPRLAALLDHPHVIHGRLDKAAAADIRQMLTTAGVWDATAGAAIHAARTRGWPVLTADHTRLHRIDPTLDVDLI